MDFIEKNLLELIAIIIAVIIPSILYILQQSKQRKSIGYEILQDRLDIASNTAYDGLRIFYQDKEVDHLFLYVIKIINSGSTHIASSDYETPIEICFGKKINLLSAELIEQEPKDLIIDMNLSNNSILIAPTLLNSKDYFIFKILVSGSPDSGIAIKARIKGIKKIERILFRKSRVNLLYLGFNVVCLASIFVITGVVTKIVFIPLQYIVVGSFVSYALYSSIILLFYKN